MHHEIPILIWLITYLPSSLTSTQKTQFTFKHVIRGEVFVSSLTNLNFFFLKKGSVYHGRPTTGGGVHGRRSTTWWGACYGRILFFWIFFLKEGEASTIDAPPLVEASMAGASPCGGAPAMDASTSGGASMVDAFPFKKKKNSEAQGPKTERRLPIARVSLCLLRIWAMQFLV